MGKLVRHPVNCTVINHQWLGQEDHHREHSLPPPANSLSTDSETSSNCTHCCARHAWRTNDGQCSLMPMPCTELLAQSNVN